MQRIQKFWMEVGEEIKEQQDFKSYKLPLARIKKIMKADKDVKVITDDCFCMGSSSHSLFPTDDQPRSSRSFCQGM